MRGISDGRQLLRERVVWAAGYAAVFFVGLVIAAIAVRRSSRPFVGVSGSILLLIMLAWFLRPRLSLYATAFLALVGDIVTIPWWPFNKNLSSWESIFYVGDGIVISPLELVLFSGIAVTALRNFSGGRRLFEWGPLGRPLLIFSGLVLLGLVRGLGSGGDLRIAMWEMRPLFYIVMMYLLVNTICRTPRELRILMWCVAAAIFVQTLLTVEYLVDRDLGAISDLESLNEHGSTLGQNLLLLLALASLSFRGVGAWQRILLSVACVPTMYVYVISQRRAGVVTLGVALVLLAIVLFWRQRKTFWKVVPIAALVATGYVGAFWNAQGQIAFPAQAVKTVIAPGELSAEDEQSDLYRIAENINLYWTIQASPYRGLGFGQAFYRPFPLPDISSFTFNAYMPHNSFLWIWIKTGFLGFATIVYVLGRAVMIGANETRRMRDGPDAVVVACATFFVVMYGIYTYVDIGWDSRNMVLLGLAFSIASGPGIRRAGQSNSPDELGSGSGDLDQVDRVSGELDVEDLVGRPEVSHAGAGHHGGDRIVGADAGQRDAVP
jgi:O-antigen ligase